MSHTVGRCGNRNARPRNQFPFLTNRGSPVLGKQILGPRFVRDAGLPANWERVHIVKTTGSATNKMQSFVKAVFVLLCVAVLGSMAQYGGYAPKPVSYQHHVQRTPAYAYEKQEGGYAPCGALMLYDCSSNVVQVPCGSGHHYHQTEGGHQYGAYDHGWK
ncbi:hypothetical protein ZHAS_00002656 [Anopheles sinensis]|uniref:Uncharacterized protein n=1 Tax=Anopheles sinensis TaxID=74873 RepID=A0A084VCQ9_ANOSI|nr:hypothetical protein ZHAS_00002656 [Anopheles sinensis]